MPPLLFICCVPADIPARVVTGYQGGEINPIGHFLEVRQADAHAWAEVWLDGKGWVRFDPTAAIAPERIEQSIDIGQLVEGGAISYVSSSEAAKSAFNWLKQAQQLWGHVDYNWQRWVINYDNKNQSKFLSSWGIADSRTMVYWLMAITAVLTALLSWFLLYQKQKAIDPALLIYNRFCKKLAKQGLLRRAGEGAKDFAGRVKMQLPEQATAIDEITTVFIRLRYGKQAGQEDLKLLAKLVAVFKA